MKKVVMFSVTVLTFLGVFWGHLEVRIGPKRESLDIGRATVIASKLACAMLAIVHFVSKGPSESFSL
jgi:hypothetical protein